MYIHGFGGGWRTTGYRSIKHADRHGWTKTPYNSCGDPIMCSHGHIFEYLRYTYDAGHTHESCVVKRRIRKPK